MKKTNFSLVLLAAVMGSAITMAAFIGWNQFHSKGINVEHLAPAPVVGAAYTFNKEGEIVPLDFTDVAEKVTPAVVHIRSTVAPRAESDRYRGVPDQDDYNNDLFRWFFGPDFRFEQPAPSLPQPRVGSGSGVIINHEGYIVTNNHVIQGADDIEVILNDNRIFKAKVVGTDPSTDLALLQIRETNLPFVPLVNSDEVKVGEWVLAVGNPFNLNSTVTAGIISAKARNINILQDRSAIESFLQTDAAINPGNSGGALVNLQSGLVGINTAIASTTGVYAGYGFAIPSNIVNKVVEDLIEYGMVQRGYLGLIIRSVDGNLAKEKRLETTEGVFVDSIAANSAAGEAGVKVGDVIRKVNEVETRSSSQLLETIGRLRPGDKVTLLVDRFGKEMEFEVVLRNQDGKAKMVARAEEGVLDKLGIEVGKVDPATARKLGIDGGLKVTSIGQGIIRSHTDMREGFIITKVDGKAPGDVEDITIYLEKTTGGVMLEGIYEDYPGTYYYAFGL
jgi:Do/DeqQ family serine protease